MSDKSPKRPIPHQMAHRLKMSNNSWHILSEACDLHDSTPQSDSAEVSNNNHLLSGRVGA